ncbi:lysosomal thioesterase PPT2-A-like isoform X1 [Biomphalaria glabrata]|uniref:palmitoyl-CoA hydrolase n=1 Tax=Biomphalaria glabrata TaxID=6526 RepID=A0A9W3BH23_BIOGL|nr:lysosomal thioesterase PPT2-A-like isoform X1 [Biomphalaria glabrata]XP_055898737.1 lysosomal thioesterase PPT2-A-like isoform X1 [Biomphalaria glabrata]XP_055898738.1 lysosomal thioesterase PPT2-A-like isoform X1 [Biomphalaria glabrata]
MPGKVLVLLMCLLLHLGSASGYKHVVFVHGLLAGPSEFDYFIQLIQEYHPGTPVTNVDFFTYGCSFANIWKQVEDIAAELKPVLTNETAEGTVLICFSQGGVICRGLLATVPHNVVTFISLSAPLAGQYGVINSFPWIPKFFKNVFGHLIYMLFYTSIGQKCFSLANYWNDPHHRNLYRKHSSFLAVINNETKQIDPRSQEFKDNFLRVQNIVLVGGPDDGVISPWQSSQFATYDDEETVVPMNEQEWFTNDAFGLRTLSLSNKIYTHIIPGIRHQEWHTKQTVFETCIKPWL